MIYLSTKSPRQNNQTFTLRIKVGLFVLVFLFALGGSLIANADSSMYSIVSAITPNGLSPLTTRWRPLAPMMPAPMLPIVPGICRHNTLSPSGHTPSIILNIAMPLAMVKMYLIPMARSWSTLTAQSVAPALISRSSL